MTRVEASPIDPRIRERRAEVLRSQARRRLRRALVVVAVAAAAVCGWVLLHSSLLSARVITVVGAVHTPTAEIVDAAGLSHHPPLLDVGTANAAAVERLPWVSSATVAREWPDGVRITVVERTPAAAVAAGTTGGWAVVDRSGRVLAIDAARPSGVVAVSGTGPPGRPGSVLADARPALRVAGSLPKAFGGQVVDVQQNPAGDVTLHLRSALTVYLGSTASLRQKYEDVAALLAGAHVSAGQSIDVSVPATPVVKG